MCAALNREFSYRCDTVSDQSKMTDAEVTYVTQDTSIKVTPEMIEAGRAGEREWTKRDRTVDRVVWIYRSMEAVRRGS